MNSAGSARDSSPLTTFRCIGFFVEAVADVVADGQRIEQGILPAHGSTPAFLHGAAPLESTQAHPNRIDLFHEDAEGTDECWPVGSTQSDGIVSGSA
jgi:hypothetical protein